MPTIHSPLRIRYYHPAESLTPYISSYSVTDIVDDAPPALSQPGWDLRFILAGHTITRFAAMEIKL